MQVFLKKIFRKDIVAIIQNIINAIINRIKYSNFPIWYNKFDNKLINFFSGHRLEIPIVIYQPGKVGSSTVHLSLKIAFEKLDLTTPIHHAHNLNHIEIIEKNIQITRKDPAPTLKKLAESKVLRQEIDQDPNKKWNIVSLVRDPVALRVSTMFQILDEYIPDWAERRKENTLSIEDLQQLLLTGKEFSPVRLTEWFDKQVKAVFGFDVFASPFDQQKGYEIYRPKKSRFSFMLIRLEDLDRVGPQAFNQFIGIRRFKIINQNVGEQKAYSELYKQFKSAPLPAEYLETAYNTPYARHFYTPQEIETFRQRWLKPK